MSISSQCLIFQISLRRRGPSKIDEFRIDDRRATEIPAESNEIQKGNDNFLTKTIHKVPQKDLTLIPIARGLDFINQPAVTGRQPIILHSVGVLQTIRQHSGIIQNSTRREPANTALHISNQKTRQIYIAIARGKMYGWKQFIVQNLSPFPEGYHNSSHFRNQIIQLSRSGRIDQNHEVDSHKFNLLLARQRWWSIMGLSYNVAVKTLNASLHSWKDGRNTHYLSPDIFTV